MEFLVTELGFTVFGIEASYAASQPINDYVLHGTGDPATVLAGQHYVAWDTEEFAALLDWLRAHNLRVPDHRKVKFSGLDFTYNDYGRRAVLGYLARVAPDKTPGPERQTVIWPGKKRNGPCASMKKAKKRSGTPCPRYKP